MASIYGIYACSLGRLAETCYSMLNLQVRVGSVQALVEPLEEWRWGWRKIWWAPCAAWSVGESTPTAPVWRGFSVGISLSDLDEGGRVLDTIASQLDEDEDLIKYAAVCLTITVCTSIQEHEQRIKPSCHRNIEQTAEIFLGTWTMIILPFLTATANGSSEFARSLWHSSSSPTTSAHTFW